MRNADIPLSCIDKRFHDALTHSYCTQAVAAIESLVNDAEGNLQEPWNPDLVAYCGQGIYQGMNCMQAWKVIPKPAVVAILDAVRNRILNFALELEAEYPNAGEAPVNSNPVPQEKVNQIFNTYISGDVQNVATGSTHVNQKVTNNSNDLELFKNLLDALHNSEGDRLIISQLAGSVEEMQACQGSPLFREHYHKFMSVLADHMQIFGPIVAPFLPALTALMF